MAVGQISRRAAIDTSTLIAYANGDQDVLALIEALSKENVEIYIPTPVLAEALRGGPKDAPVNRVLNKRNLFFEIATTPTAGRRAGALLGAANAESSLTMDALIIATAIEHGASAIVTADTDDHTRLAPPDFAVLPLH